MLIGSMAAYALARFTYKPKIAADRRCSSCWSALTMAAVIALIGVDWRIAAA